MSQVPYPLISQGMDLIKLCWARYLGIFKKWENCQETPDAVSHGIDSKAVQEITDRKAELFGYMDTFLSEIRTAA